MLYGSSKAPNLPRHFKNSAFRLNLKDRRIGFSQFRRNSFPNKSTPLQIPGAWQLTLLKNSNSGQLVVYLVSGAYYVVLAPLTSLTKLQYNPGTQTIVFHHEYSSYLHSAYTNWVRDLIARFHRPFFLKIRFKGKGYYMYKNKRNTIAPQFGYAHRVYVYSQATSVKFLSKTKILLFGLSKTDTMSVGTNLKRVKPINIFTGRGVRFARQIVYKKTGKVSSYR